MLPPIPQRIAAALNLALPHVTAAIELFDAGNTLPFIARYRKEATGSLDEDQLRHIETLLAQQRALEDRRAAILAEIESQGKLTPDLRAALEAADTRTALEDLYQPYKPKRRTRAMIAREKGLEALAELIVAQPLSRQTAEQIAAPYIKADLVPTADDALAGARDIVAEWISDNPDIRRSVREKALAWGSLTAEKAKDADDPRRVYELYYAFKARLDRLKPYQTLALNRGETENVLKLKLEIAERDWRDPIRYLYRPDARSPLAPHLEQATSDAAERLLLPAIERDIRRALTETAEQHAIQVFAANLRGLLTQPPLAGQTVLGLDPGFRTGCKVAVVDPTGRLLDTATIYPHAPQKHWQAAKDTLAKLIQRHRVTLITIGNGTASRETEQLAAELIRDLPTADLHYLMVNEAGASVYSASPLARAELPDLDVSLRGAVSIARRAQDPLAELVKIDPQSIGIGLYQHDVDQPALKASLTGVVESVVNAVGVDVNTASPALLAYVAGIGPKLAEKIVAHREASGSFKSRTAIKTVSGLGPKAFEQSAGFLRIRHGDDPLDASAIHPESYRIARAVLKKTGMRLEDPPDQRAEALSPLRTQAQVNMLAAEIQCGVPTLTDILDQLVRPGRDPREDLPAPMLRADVLSMDDLQPGQRLTGTVRNVVDFGAFIDIGVKQDGLLHRSQIPRGHLLTVGDILDVEIVTVETGRGRIALGWPGGVE